MLILYWFLYCFVHTGLDEESNGKPKMLILYRFLYCFMDMESKNLDFIFENTGLLQKMTFALNNFFDNVIVNVEDEDIKKNRKILICKFHKNLEDRYSFSSLEI